MQAHHKLQAICPREYAEEFSRPVHKIGMITCGLAVLANLLPPAWLYLQYGVLPPSAAIAKGMGLALTYAVPFFIIEPIIYYPILGDAGTYMSFLTGNISNMRLPCAAVAQTVAGVKEGTREGELIATVGIALSIWLSIFAVLVGALATGWFVQFFSPWLQDAFKSYLLPATWGAVFGLFALRGLRYAPAALVLALSAILLKWPPSIAIPITVFGTIIFGRVIYNCSAGNARDTDRQGNASNLDKNGRE
ncbi:MAG: hypothetical protein JZU50_03055 [Desulfobulbaceae bacterium]|nr:hypothetical protein [Desulfobulbaceae bacterium]